MLGSELSEYVLSAANASCLLSCALTVQMEISTHNRIRTKDGRCQIGRLRDPLISGLRSNVHAPDTVDAAVD